jgi:glucose-induced degradation protein 4
MVNDVQEHFLVPDHTVKNVPGASYDGFYYICYSRSSNTIEGYYYHQSSEWYVDDSTERLRGC